MTDLIEKRNILVKARSNVINMGECLSVPNKQNLFGGMSTRTQRIQDRVFRRELNRQEIGYGKQIENIDKIIDESLIPVENGDLKSFEFNEIIHPLPQRRQARFFRGGI